VANFDPDNADDLDRFPTRECSFCAAPGVTAYWAGKGIVLSCSVCAVQSLPALAADAIIAGAPDLERAARHAHVMFNRLRGEYWRAVALAISRERRRR
jgi:hypothetical protein